MKKLLFIIQILLIYLIPMFGQVPKVISYQGFLTDESQNPISGDKILTVSFYEVPEEGAAIWQEIKVVAVENGVFSTYLGNENPLNLPFDKTYWLGIKVGSEAELTPRIQLSASPYSFNSLSVADSIITTSKLVDSSVTSSKIASDQVVKSINNLKDNIVIVAEGGASLSTQGDTLIINAGAGSVTNVWN
ncbi:MAG: hypothetical protein OQJ81_04765, partial [Melioribacteraceae bacterium]|nr:hypothetical protein [Melioribacteraceae bacterium]